ncbi:MAG TPA: lipase family protein [Thermoanaerobaculia bacterium]|nr:lipase family protein [Thermoanaerobaculia bacterium]
MKEIPPATIETILPPNEDYTYFENSGSHPFDFKADGFSMVNAWWLAEASLLAYADRDFVTARFAEAGLAAEGRQPFTARGSTQCYVAHTEDFVIVAFRGTQVLKRGASIDFLDVLRDFSVDTKFTLVDCAEGGRIHKGFKAALDEVWEEQVRPHLDRLDDGHRTFWFTGHSLGGALATLAASRFKNVNGVYTFGSPVVGDQKFAQSFRVAAKTYRFVNNEDLVARPRGNLVRFAGRIGDSISSLVGRSPKEPIIDHAPLFYALHIWNIYEREQQGV